MPEITSIEPQQRRKHRCSIFIDQDFFCGVNQETVARLKLKPGQAVEPEKLKRIVEQDEEIRAREMCLRALDVRARSRHELAERLNRRGVEAVVTVRVLDRLTQARLINDEDFARMLIRERLRAKGYGRRRLQVDLARAGVDRSLAARVMDEEVPRNEQPGCEDLATRKIRQYQSLPRELGRRRLAAFLERRGFSSGEVYRAVNKVLPKDEDS